MARTIRKYWGAFTGRVTLNYNWPVIDRDSVVLVTVSEYNSNHVRFIGSATIGVSNVAPHGPPFDPNHGVTFVVHVDWGSPLNIVTDITVLDKPIEIQTYVPPTPRNIGLRMQYQETTEWCWMAVATSVSHFYNPASTWTQCQVMTVVGHNVNGFPSDTSACPSAATLAAHPELGPILANPYDKKAEFVLNNPVYGIDARYIKSGGVSDPLKVTGNLGSIPPSSLSLAQIAAEVASPASHFCAKKAFRREWSTRGNSVRPSRCKRSKANRLAAPRARRRLPPGYRRSLAIRPRRRHRVRPSM